MIKHSKNVPPFLRYCSATIPAMFDDSMSYYEALCALWKWLQTNLVDVVNNNAEVTEKYIKIVDDLKKYVEDYFKNLDVQEEINNKLDTMAETGELAEIISAFLETSIYEESISYESGYDSDTRTHYYIAHIPFKNTKGERIVLKHGFADDVETTPKATQIMSDWNRKHNVTLATNASIFYAKETIAEEYKNRIPGVVIHGGEIISNTPYDLVYSSGQIWYVGLKEDGTLKKYAITTTGDEMISDGVVESFTCFNQIAINGVIQTEGQFIDVENYKYQWCLLGQNTETKDLYFIVTNGKGIYNEQGLTARRACEILIEKGADNIFRLDNGGSVTMSYKGRIVNSVSDDNFQSERKIPDFIYFEKENTSTPLTDEMFERDRITGETYQKMNKNRHLSTFENVIETYRVKNSTHGSFIQRISDTDSTTDFMSIILDSPSHPESFTIWNGNDNRSIIRVDKDGSIVTPAYNITNSAWETITSTSGSFTLNLKNMGMFLFIKGKIDTTTASIEGELFKQPDDMPKIKGDQLVYPVIAGGTTLGKVIVKNSGDITFLKANATGTATINIIAPLV